MEDVLIHRMRPAAWLKINGEDAATFLQGQFTNELRRSEAYPATYGLWLNQKGRVLADSHVLQVGPKAFEVVSLDSPETAIRERLEAYIIADDVVVEAVGADMAGVLLVGGRAGDVVRRLGIELAGPGQFSVAGAGRAFRVWGWSALEGWLLLGGRSQVEEWCVALTAIEGDGVVCVEERERIDRVLAASGVPVIPRDLGAGDLPNEATLERVAISFTKGCYLGQEVMARLHNLGQVRRRLCVVRAVVDASRVPPLAPLFREGRRAGEVRCMFREESGHAVGLAMVQWTGLKSGDLLGLEESGVASVEVVRVVEPATR